jgi:hypothetical protein
LDQARGTCVPIIENSFDLMLGSDNDMDVLPATVPAIILCRILVKPGLGRCRGAFGESDYFTITWLN